MVPAEVGVDDPLVAHDLLRRALGDHAAFGQAHHPVGDRHDDVHVVLDEDDRAPRVTNPSHVLEQRLHERGVHSGHRLVEHDELRVGHQRACHLEQLALAARHRGGQIVALVREPEIGEQRHRAFADFTLLRAPREPERRESEPLSRLAGRSEQHVVEHRHPGQGLGELERAHHAPARDAVRGPAVELGTVEAPPAAVGAIEPGQHVEERRLARTVGSDERGDRVAFDLEMLHQHRGESAEAPRDPVDDEHRIRLRYAGLRRQLACGCGCCFSHRASLPCASRGSPGAGR